MFPITHLYCNYDADFYGTDYPKLKYQIVGSNSYYYKDIEEGTDILSMEEFDYSMLRELVVQSRFCTYVVDVQKLLSLSLSSLTLDESSTYINGTVQDIINGMSTVTNITLTDFNCNSSFDLSKTSAHIITLDSSEVSEIILPSRSILAVRLLDCDINSKDLLPSLYDSVLTNGSIEKITVRGCRYSKKCRLKYCTSNSIA